ncbi:hypothetical protein BC833DRAFT_577462 [Globomyces pollinis-pini]|nr:hypothetical protein BC833DRAFT_577462 [Globomyces pollinis-pini]KAJ3000842.1 hypothetical protein HDV02_002305 [Globomyces sp. JEL0801]
MECLNNDIKGICDKLQETYTREIIQSIPVEIRSLTMGNFVDLYNGDIDECLGKLNAYLFKQSNNNSVSTRSIEISARDSISSSKTFDDWRSSMASNASSYRRVTLRGADENIELCCLLPGLDDQLEDTTQSMESLKKEELIKLKASLQAAQEQANSLLAKYGI